MNKKALEGLKKEEENISELKDVRNHIKDLEKELEFMHLREPEEVEYIARLERDIRELYENERKLNEAN